mmetsp:Transcript_7479/g.18141  ORF Transcript_7479/g.18141 Transcript_7479/m.18141 type:complete len:540 (-) Transcript_7479:54-1673(-)|eukprot:CAMPEP_0173422606 /NCGR_PEP_ID=MMETSP1357-20121228/3245_1 /TAXON_ID=77926 /ORGANISM="Hemiselmis rufescens, Strain PCC563" /LENGTH=539 /DNA_ID=CAMNT_0014385653 /DNA_START=25 /DNA_END=1644 /DNA_ORIENTATION=+
MGDRIKYGNLEGMAGTKPPDPKPDEGDAKKPKVEVVQFSEETMAGKEKHQAQLIKFQLEMRARTIAAPTNDADVKKELRRFMEPVCLFGEGPAERRDRLKVKLAKMEVDQGLSASEILKGEEDRMRTAVPALEDRTEAFFTEGSEELKQARLWILEYSLPHSKSRLGHAKRKQVMLDAYLEAREQKLRKEEEAFKKGEVPEQGGGVLGTEGNEVEEEHMSFVDKAGRYRNMDMTSSQIGDVRPISGVAFSSDGGAVATCSWSGIAKLWKVPDCDNTHSLIGHRERLSDVQFNPQWSSASLGDASASDTACCATGSADSTVKIWGGGSMKVMATLGGHAERVCRIAWHPSGKFIGSTSYDRTWRLWDAETTQELLCQEGHSRAVYTIAFQGDGALVATAGLDSYGRIWDLRTGRAVLALAGHVKQVLGLDFCPSGVKCATGSDDNTIRLWDLRKKKSYYTIPAHPNLISSVRYSDCGDFLFSSSYDRSVKVWNLRNCTSVKTLAGHDEKIMRVDVAPGGTMIATASYDRTWKLWAPGKFM